MFSRLVRAVEPFLKFFSHRVVSPWKGNHIEYNDLRRSVVPWGFVSQAKVLESVKPHRAEGTMEKRAEHLNLDTWEFLRGTEEAYRCVARLFAPDSASAGVSQQKIADRDSGSGVRDDRPVGSVAVGEAFEGKSEEEPSQTDFLDLDVASPEMSMFLNDVLESYNLRGLVPRLSISSVKATLCNVGIRLGGISKNTNFLGLISADEVKYHLTMGMLGPEGVVINEMEGRAPQKIIADVMLTCEEDFVLEDVTGTVVHRDSSEGPKVHYLTLQSNIWEGKKLQWQVTNINDVIKPNLAYYFARFGH